MQEIWPELLEAAWQVQKKAYSPYSHFQVGAALWGHDRQIYTGCNVENASLGLSICAERVALFKAVTVGVTAFRALVLVTEKEEWITPCGACRQVLAEFSPELKVFLVNRQGKIKEYSLAELLPAGFTWEGKS